MVFLVDSGNIFVLDDFAVAFPIFAILNRAPKYLVDEYFISE